MNLKCAFVLTFVHVTIYVYSAIRQGLLSPKQSKNLDPSYEMDLYFLLFCRGNPIFGNITQGKFGYYGHFR